MKNYNINLWAVLRHDLKDYGKKYLMWTGILIGTLAAITAFAAMQKYYLYDPAFYAPHSFDPMKTFGHLLFWFGIIITGCVVAAQTFAPLGTKGGAISNLMLPATQLDKYLTRWIICVPAFIAVYYLCFQLVDVLRYLTLYTLIDDHQYLHFFGFDVFDMGRQEKFLLLSLALFGQSFFVLGSAVWPKHGFLYTALSVFAIEAASAITAGIYYSFLIRRDNFETAMNYNGFDSNAFCWTIVGFAFLGTVINYVLAYFRYKEIEIIPRW